MKPTLSVALAGSCVAHLLGESSTWAFMIQPHTQPFVRSSSSSTARGYENSNRETPSDNPSTPVNVWSVLANTEKWMCDTLTGSKPGDSQQPSQKQQKEEKKEKLQSVPKFPPPNNPFSRKEVSYVCETSSDPAMILAGIFRKLKEARMTGENHGTQQEELAEKMGEQYIPSTFRQTQVLVIPGNPVLMKNFAAFDKVIEAINHARRNARDYVTEVSLDKLDERMYGDGEKDWSVSVNCGHLHPNFGEKTPEQELMEMQEEEENGEVDLNLKAYKERRLQARRSPYPSVVVELRAVPPPDFSTSTSPSLSQEAQLEKQRRRQQRKVDDGDEEDDDDDDVSGSDSLQVNSESIAKLEALFGKAAHIRQTNEDGTCKPKKDDFYDSIGSQIEEISSITPMTLAQNWIAKNDPRFVADSCGFTGSDTKHVDEAYEFVFTNLAMQSSQFLVPKEKDGEKSYLSQHLAQKRQYLVMSNFLTSSATSFEKFAREVNQIIAAMPQLNKRVELSCLHPEHIEAALRSPVPVFVLQWLD